ncbi:MAG: hypothetical protein J6C38_02300 [Oscillospiraceae bacterium]|nr:hypothetical protein [Oscillospiraceae bacterium]
MKKLLKKLTAVVSAAAVALTCLSFGGTVGLTAAAAEETVGAFTVTGGTSGTDYKYENNVLTILKETPLAISGTTTTDRIEVASGVSANITLAGVNISSAGYPAFKIVDNSTGNVTITLKDGTENTLKGGTYSAGLQKNGNAEGIGKLTIKGGTEGTGKLEATSSKSGGAGIGSSDNQPCSNIEICGGTVTATSCKCGAGIGGGGGGGKGKGNGSNITISGGTVTANGGYNGGAGIGGGRYGAGSNITISGGTVTANGGEGGAGIGGGRYGAGSNITISGGTVTATGGAGGAGIGGGREASGSDIIITGGSVKAVAGSSANAIGGGYKKEAVTPTNGTNEVYLLTIANPDGAEVLINGVSYTPVNHKAVDSNDGNLYVYLPAKTVAAPNVVKVGTEETKYVYDTKWLIVPTVTAPTSKTGLVYNGTAQELISAGSTDFGTLLYSLDDTTYSEDIPTATKADSYTVYYKVQGNDNVSDVDAKTVSASIGKATPGGDTFRNINVVRGVGTFTEPVFTGVDGQPLGGGVKYGERDYDQLVEYLKTLSSSGVFCRYEFTPNDWKNYNNVKGDISFYIYDVVFKVGNDDATAENAVTVKANPTYGDTWADILTLKDGLKAVLLDETVTTGFSLDVTGSPNAGSQTYEVLFNGTIGGKTYTDHVVATGTVDVAKKELTVSAGDFKVSKVYDGTTDAGTGNDGDFKVDGLVGNDSVTINADTIGEYSSADVGTNYSVDVTISLTGNANYKLGNTTVSVPAEITAKAITPTVEGSGTHTYTGSAITPNVTVKDGETVLVEDKDYTITVTNNINAGVATVTITAKSGGNYTFDEQTRYFKIFKATPNVTALTAKTGLVYNGTAKELISAGSTNFGTLVYSLNENGEYSTAIPKGTNAGTYTVYYKVQGNDNVNDSVAQTVSASIGKAAATITAESYTIKVGSALPTYKYTVTGLVNNDTLPIDVTISCNAADINTAGTHTITVSGAENSTNYTFAYVNGTLTITDKEIQTITAADVTLTYGNAGKKITAATSGDGALSYEVKTGKDVIKVADDGTITALKAGTAIVEVTAAANDDYAKAIKAVVVKVNKAAVTIKANSYTVKVGGDFPATLDYTVTGLADGESLGVSPELSCETDNTSTAGTYKITVKFNKTEDEKYIYTVQNGTLTVQRKSSGGTGGSGGSSGGGSYRPTTPTTTNPSIGGSAKSWSDVAADLGKLTTGSEATIELNGSTTVPVDVIKSIADKDNKVTFAIDSVFSWVVDGSKINTPAAADLTFVKTTSTKSNGLRGVEGTQFRINNTNIPTSLEIAFKSSHAGKFANLYENVDGKLMFVTCSKLGEDGKVILPDVTENGNYVAMLCELSDRPGDMDNDGITNAKDALSVLKDSVGLEKGKNPLVSDLNNDGFINAKDALLILKKSVGLL